MPTLQGIEHEIENALCALDNADLTEEQRQEATRALEAYLGDLAAAEANKVEGYLRLESREQASVKWLKEEAARLTARAKTIEAGLEWRKGYLLRIMQERGLKSIKGMSGSISRQASPLRLLIGPDLPEGWKKEVVTVDVQPDKERIKTALEAGQEVPGAILAAGEHIRFNRSRGKAE